MVILKIHYLYESFYDKRSHDKSTNTRKMAALDAFKNCSNFTIEQTDAIAHVRGVSAAVCCAILSTVLVVLVILAILPKTRNRLFGTVVKRLSFGLIAASVVNQLALALQLVHYYNYDEKICKVNGFFNQYFGAVQLIFVLGISLALLFRIGQKIIPSWRSFLKTAEEKTFTCHGMKISKPEVATVVLMIVLPLLFVWIPFAINSYGPFATWCWIRILEQNCTTNAVGLWEQIWLWDVPFGIAAVLTHVLLIGSLCLLGCGIKNAKVHNYKLLEVGIIDYLLLLVILVFVFFLYALETIARFYAFNRHRFLFWVLSAIFSPLIGTFIPLSVLVAIHLPISATCKWHQHHKRKSQAHREDEPNTVNKSDAINVPSHTTWDPPHSSFDNVPFVQMD